MIDNERITIKDKQTCAVCGLVVANGDMAQAARVYICNSCAQEMVKNPIAEVKSDFNPDYAIPPGETLKEVMETLGIPEAELEKQTEINKIITGEQPITHDIATMLEFLTNVPAKMWLNLEANYIEQLAKLRETNK